MFSEPMTRLTKLSEQQKLTSQLIQAELEELQSDKSPDRLEYHARALEISALPVVLSAKSCLALDKNGVVLLCDPGMGTRVEYDPIWIRAAYSRAAIIYPQLAFLVPERLPDSEDCCHCQCVAAGTESHPANLDSKFVELFQNDICTGCGGWGWLPRTDSEAQAEFWPQNLVDQHLRLWIDDATYHRYALSRSAELAEFIEAKAAEFSASESPDPYGYRAVAEKSKALPVYQCETGFLALAPGWKLLVYDRRADVIAPVQDAILMRIAYSRAAAMHEELACLDFPPPARPENADDCPFCKGDLSFYPQLAAKPQFAMLFGNSICTVCQGQFWLPSGMAQIHYDRAQKLDDLARQREAVASGARATIARCSNILERNAKDADSYRDRAAAYLITEEPQMALADFDRLLELEPENADGYKGRAEAYAMLKQDEKAIEQYGLALQFGHEWISKGMILDRRAKLFEKIGKYEDAIRDFTEAIAEVEKYPTLSSLLYMNRSQLYKKLGEDALAKDDWEKYQRLSAENIMRAKEAERKIADRLSPEYIQYRQRSQALTDLDKFSNAIAKQPDDGESFFHRARAYEAVGEDDKALSDFSRVLELHPAFSGAYIQAAELLLRLKKYDSALKIIDDGLSHCGSGNKLLLLRASALDGLGRTSDAVDDLNEAVLLSRSWDGAAREARGFLLEKLGKLAESARDKEDSVARAGNTNMQQKMETITKGTAYLVRNWAYLDTTGNLVIKPDIDTCNVFGDGLAPARPSNRFMHGYIDRSGQWAIPPQFGSANIFLDGLACVSFEGGFHGKYGYINTAGELVVKPKYDLSFGFKNGYARVKIGGLFGRWGLIDTSGNELVELRFEECFTFREDRALTQLGGKYGYLDKTGQFAIEPQFTEARIFQQGRAAVKQEGKWGYIDVEGNMAVTPHFDEAQDFWEGLAVVAIDGRWGAIDTAGNIVIQLKYPSQGPFCDGLSFVWIDDGFAAIDAAGAIVIPPRFLAVHNFREGFAGVRLENKWGFIDKTGELVVKPQFDMVRSFREGLSAVRLDDKSCGLWGFVNKEDMLVAQPQFNYVSDMYEGLAQVGSFEQFA